jgi:hypothetical protein
MRAEVQRGVRTTTWRGHASEVAMDYTLNRATSPKPIAGSPGPGPAAADAVRGRREVPGCQTDGRTASPVLAAAVKGRTWRLAGGPTQSAPGRPQFPLATCRRSGCPAGGVRRFRGAGSVRRPGPRQRTEMFELVPSRSRDATRRVVCHLRPRQRGRWYEPDKSPTVAGP